jgi:hypothetical protein
MTRDRFKQALYNPCFQTNHYLEETPAGKAEKRIASFVKKINIFKRWKKNDKNS